MKKLMKKLIPLVLTLIAFLPAQASQDPVVVFTTSAGNFEVTLFAEKSPITVNNFLALVDKGHYNGMIFHRVIKNFMIQGGGLDRSMKRIGGVTPIRNEADNGLKNVKGTIAMARTGDPHSATDQFFINTKSNPNLDHTGKSIRGWGYAVFGQVSNGMDTVMKIESTETTRKQDRDDVPVTTIEIIRVERK